MYYDRENQKINFEASELSFMSELRWSIWSSSEDKLKGGHNFALSWAKTGQFLKQEIQVKNFLWLSRDQDRA
jgi:hypothetical protein